MKLLNLLRALAPALCILLTTGLTLHAQSRVRLVNVVNDAPSLDLYIDSIIPPAASVISNGFASELVRVAPGGHHLTVTATGAPLSTAVLDSLIQVGSDSAYTLILGGGASIDPVIVANPNVMSVPVDSALVRFVNLSPNIGTIGITASLGAQHTFTTDPATYRSVSPYRMVPASDLRLALLGDGGKAIYKSLGYLTGGTAVTVLITGDYDATNLNRLRLYALVDSDTSAQMPMQSFSLVPLAQGAFRLVHAMAGRGAVDVYRDGLTSDSTPLNYRYASVVRADLLGPHSFKVAPQGAGLAASFLDVNVNVAADTLTTLVLTGSPTGQSARSATLRTAINNVPPQGKTLLRVLNALADEGVDIRFTFADSTRQILSTLAPNGVSEFMAVPSGAIEIEAARETDGAAINVEGALPEDAVVTVIVSGADEETRPMVRYVSLYVEDNPQEQEPMQLLANASSVPVALRGEGDARAVITPNPVRGEALVSYVLSRGGELHLSLYDIMGRTAVEMPIGYRDAGAHTMRFSVEDLPPGVYGVVVHRSDGSRAALGRLVVAR